MSGQSNSENANAEPHKPEEAASSGADEAQAAEQPSAQDAAQGSADAPEVTPEQRLAELETLLADAKDRHLRAHAEMENIRKRAEREKADISKYAITNFARDMLGVSDNLKRAISAVTASEEDQSPAMKALLEGVQLTETELGNTLERHGVRIVEALGQQFDPNFHQAVMEQENKDVAAGSVIQVFQEGYQIGDRVLRPSMVVVAKGGFKAVKDPDPKATTEEAADAPASGADEEQAAPENDNSEDAPENRQQGGSGAGAEG